MRRIGSLFSGYGGLEMGIQSVLDADTAWHVEFDAAPSKILAHHWPKVPNYGDITAVDWAAVEPVEILCGGFPCQDVSLAGLRRGLHPDTRSGLWSHFALAIATLRPSLVIVENVRGLLSAEAHSDLEPDPWGVGDGRSRPALRALGAVLGDLADLGYDTEWCGIRAADAGAPHGRFRIFVVAYPQCDERARERPEQPRRAAPPRRREDAPADTAHVVVDWAGRTRHWRPEPADRRGTASDAGHDRRQGSEELHRKPADGIGASHRLDSYRRAPADAPHDDSGRGAGARAESRRSWGEYGPAIARWETVLDREAPAPTDRGRLSPRFVEWMMGLPAGHVTDVGLKRAAQLKALGNGVVPQQAALALTRLLARQGVAA